MLDVAAVLIGIVSARAAADFRVLYPAAARPALALVEQTAHTALAAISRSDALYHNIEHTTHVTLVGLEILKTKQQAEGTVPVSIWANVAIALLCHDIGYVRQICRADSPAWAATGLDGKVLSLAPGSSDAVLMPVHVNRGKRFVEETFRSDKHVDIGLVNACIERTRFPVPDEAWYAQTDDFPGLVRAADLIGQLSDARYLNKLSAIFYEFEEIGFNEMTGYERPGDLLLGYPAFYDASVVPYIDKATDYLELSEEGRSILARLYANLATARDATIVPLSNAANS